MSNFITPPSNLNLNLQNNHPLIPRENTFWLNRKVLTIHSQDRDISKWPFANEFEIELPQDYHNVQSSRLLEITFPVNLYNFSNINQNTIFRITINNDGHSHTVSGNTGTPSTNTTDTLGESATNKRLPPYYALCYIMKS